MEKNVVKIEYTETVRTCLSEITSHLRQAEIDPGPFWLKYWINTRIA